MKILKYPIAILTAFFAAGIAVTAFVPVHAIAVIAGLCLALGVACLSFFRRIKATVNTTLFSISACLTFFFASMLSVTLHDPLLQQSHYTRLLEDDKDTPVITCVVNERLKPNALSEKYFIDVVRVGDRHATGKLLATIPIDSLHPKLEAGDIIIATASPQPIAHALNPYSFDYSRYMRRQGVYHQLRLRDNYITAGQEKGVKYYVNRFRATLISSFDKHRYDPVTLNVIKALIFGQRQDMDQATTDSYTQAGVIHVLAISGLHFAVLFFMFNLLMKSLERSRSGRILHFVLMMALLWGFAFIAGLSASVVRSVVMFSFISLGTLLNRHSNNTINSIAISMLVLLLANPDFLFDVGFQLSYAAVIGIVWLHPLIRLPRSKFRVLNMLNDMATVSLAAQLGVLPLTLYYFNQFPILFLLANIVAIPLSNVVLTGGIVTLLLNFIWADAALLAGRILKGCIWCMNAFINWISSADMLVIKDIPFTAALMLLLYLTIFALAFWLYRKSFRRTVVLLVSVLLFQAAYGATALAARDRQEAIILNNRKSTAIACKENGRITLIGNDSLALSDKSITDYKRGSFNAELTFRPLKNLLYVNRTKVLVIDSTGVYPQNIRPDVILLVQSPKVNPERLFRSLKPKAVVADATNYRTYTERWKATCGKLKIPFHATAEKGFYRIK